MTYFKITVHAKYKSANFHNSTEQFIQSDHGCTGFDYFKSGPVQI